MLETTKHVCSVSVETFFLQNFFLANFDYYMSAYFCLVSSAERTKTARTVIDKNFFLFDFHNIHVCIASGAKLSLASV